MHIPAATSISEFRQRISELFSEAVWHGQLVEVVRGLHQRAMLIGFPQLERLLEPVSFHPEVIAEDGSIAIWLPELELWGHGESFAEAKEDLAAEVRDYVGEYLGDSDRYLASPNRGHHFPAIVRAYVADRSGHLDDVLFAAPTDVAGARELVPA